MRAKSRDRQILMKMIHCVKSSSGKMCGMCAALKWSVKGVVLGSYASFFFMKGEDRMWFMKVKDNQIYKKQEQSYGERS